jgi:hypothetical protein
MEKKIVKLLPSEITHSAVPMGVFRWRANPKKDTPLDDILDPQYWDVVKDKFRVVEEKHQGQIVEIYPVDGKYFAELLVVKLDNGQVCINKLSYTPLDEDRPRLTVTDFKIEHRGGRNKWSILRNDGTVIEEFLASEASAKKSLAVYLDKM